MRPEENAPFVSLADVAKMGRVSRPAVSNWRRRYEDFPQPVQETGATSLFRLAEVERWMREHGKRFIVPSVAQQVWSAFAIVRGAVLPEDAAQAAMVLLGLGVVADRLGATERRALDDVLREGFHDRLHEALRRLAYKATWSWPLDEAVVDVDVGQFRACMPFLQSIDGLASEYGRGPIFEALMAMLARSSRSGGDHETPLTVAQLMTSLAEPIRGTVYDPACGRGGLLYAAHQRVKPGVAVRLVGQELNRPAWQTARLRLLTHGISAQISISDTLSSTADSELRADLVLADPPFGMSWRLDRTPDAHRWPFGAPPPSRADLAWLQHSITRLQPTGRALHITSLGPLSRTGAEAHIRHGLVASGCVHAIITLPSGLYGPRTNIPVALWVVSQPRNLGRSGVLLVDATRLGRRVGGRTELSDGEIDAITECYRTWRDAARSGAAIDNALDGALRYRALAVDQLMDEGCNLLPARWLDDPPDDPWRSLDEIRVAETSLRSTWDKLATAAHPDVSAVIAPSEHATPKLTIRELVDRRLIKLIRAQRVDPALIGSGDTPLIRGQDLGDDWIVSPSGQIDPQLLGYQPKLSCPGDVVVLADSSRPRAGVDRVGGAVIAAPLYVVRWSTPEADPLVTAVLITNAMSQGHLVGSVMPRVPIHTLELPALDEESAQWLATVLPALIEQRQLASAVVDATRKLTDRVVKGLGSGRLRVRDTRMVRGHRA